MFGEAWHFWTTQSICVFHKEVLLNLSVKLHFWSHTVDKVLTFCKDKDIPFITPLVYNMFPVLYIFFYPVNNTFMPKQELTMKNHIQPNVRKESMFTKRERKLGELAGSRSGWSLVRSQNPNIICCILVCRWDMITALLHNGCLSQPHQMPGRGASLGYLIPCSC